MAIPHRSTVLVLLIQTLSPKCHQLQFRLSPHSPHRDPQLLVYSNYRSPSKVDPQWETHGKYPVHTGTVSQRSGMTLMKSSIDSFGITPSCPLPPLSPLDALGLHMPCRASWPAIGRMSLIHSGPPYNRYRAQLPRKA